MPPMPVVEKPVDNPVDVYLHIDGERTEGKIRLAPSQRINLNAQSYAQLVAQLGKSRVTVNYALSKWRAPEFSEE